MSSGTHEEPATTGEGETGGEPQPDTVMTPSGETIDVERFAHKPGPIRWMAKNAVASNLLMLILMIGGLIVGTQVKQEVFPEFQMDYVNVNVVYPGASPAEVEKGVVEAIENAVSSVDGIKKVSASAMEGNGSVTVELLEGTDATKALGDIKNAVDRITSFPRDAEEPTVSLMVSRRRVIDLVIYSPFPDLTDPEAQMKVLQAIAERAKDDLVGKDNITYAEIGGIRPAEVSIEVPQEVLRRHDLTLRRVADEVGAASLELPAGGVKTPSGETLVRLDERADWREQFENLTILSSATGTRMRLGELAEVHDGYEDNDQATYFNGMPAAKVSVFRVGEQTPVDVANTVKDYVQDLKASLPPGIEIATWMDDSEIFQERMDLLFKNAALGLVLVLLVLGMFLRPRLAFWVTLGIPISFAGSLLLMPTFDVSINMISMFAFIVTLGMVVDDAIVVGENIYEYRQQGMSAMRAAVVGARQVAMPVIFAILTTCAAFFPMFMVPGVSGKIFRVIPSIVIAVLLISLVESLFVLPSHLGHEAKKRDRGVLYYVGHALKILLLPLAPLAWVFDHLRRFMSAGLQWFVHHVYKPVLELAVEFRYVTIAIGFATFATAIGVMAGGRIDFTFMPKMEGDRIVAQVKLPFGSPVEETERVQKHIVQSATTVLDDYGDVDQFSRGMLTTLGEPLPAMGPVNYTSGIGGSHLASVEVRLVALAEREFTAAEFARRWREEVGQIKGAESLTFTYNIGASSGSPVNVQLVHRDINVLQSAATEVAAALESYPGVTDIDNGFSRGKRQLDLSVGDQARAVGVTPQLLGRQVRDAFYGAEALRQQRGRDELRVMVRLPEEERDSEFYVQELIVRTPQGGEVPLRTAATIDRGRAYTAINRENGRRVVNVTADVDNTMTNAGKVITSLTDEVLPDVMSRYPGLSYSFEGERREQQRSMRSLGIGFGLALIVIYGLLAIPFRSYIQPFVVMTAIPLGIVGALIGHMLMGYELSMISMMGIVALSGVVVNDSLVLVATANEYREAGMSPRDAIITAGTRRFRPILLTSLTTFFGLAPMIYETSVQARFLIPMALSLGFGVLFSTFIILVIVPSSYLAAEDVKYLFGVGRYRKTGHTPDDAGLDDDDDEDEDEPATGGPEPAAAPA